MQEIINLKIKVVQDCLNDAIQSGNTEQSFYQRGYLDALNDIKGVL